MFTTILTAWIIALLAVHLHYFFMFTKRTDQASNFNLKYWWKNNKWAYIMSLASIVILMVTFDWTYIATTYASALKTIPVLQMFKPIILVGFIVGWFNSAVIKLMIRKTEKHILKSDSNDK